MSSSSHSLVDMDMDLDDNDSEGDGVDVRKCDFPGCHISFREEEEWKLHIRTHIRKESLAVSSNVAGPSSTTHYSRNETRRISNTSSSSSRLSSAPRNVSFGGVYARPDGRARPFTTPSSYDSHRPDGLVSRIPYPTSWMREPDPPDIASHSQRNGRNSRIHEERKFHVRDHPYARPSLRDGYDTLNDGDQNETYNGSRVSRNRRYDRRSHSNAVVHVHVHDQGAGGFYRESSRSARRVSTSSSNSHVALRSSEDTLSNPMPTPPVERPLSQSLSRSSSSMSRESGSPSANTSRITSRTSQDTLYDSTLRSSFNSDLSLRPRKKGKERTRTRSRRYESLLFECGLGFPLWIPSPRCTPDGEYMPEIGDVGVFSHGLPFNTIFNITQFRTSLANRDGIPEGVDPPCPLESRCVTIKKRYHQPRTTLFQPEGAISRQTERTGDRSSVFTFDLSAEGGALLMLPRGGTLQKLEKTSEFKKRIRLYWRQWYDFADGKVDLDNGQALYLATGVERCSAWAMAAWDSISSYSYDELGSLELTVDEHTGACSWAFPPARCSTQTSDPPTPYSSHSNQETVFIRGFRIDRFDGNINLRSPALSLRPGNERDGDSDDDSSSRGSNSRDPPPFGESSSNPSLSAGSSRSGSGRFRVSNAQSDFLDPPKNRAQILELNLNLSSDEDDLITHPCEIINKFAFELLSRVKPTLLDSGCVAFSHDEDWISIIRDSDEEFPSDVEIVRRICSKFQFTIDGDAIYTVAMSDSDKGLLERRETSRFHNHASGIPVLVVFAESDSGRVSPASDALVSHYSAYEDEDLRPRHITRSRYDTDVRARMSLSPPPPPPPPPPLVKAETPQDAVSVLSPFNGVKTFVSSPAISTANYSPLSNASYFSTRSSVGTLVDLSDRAYEREESRGRSILFTPGLTDEPSHTGQVPANSHDIINSRIRPVVASASVAAASQARRKKEPIFICSVAGCNQRFTAKHNLKNHVNAHSGIRPFACSFCAKEFTTKHVLNRHEKTCKAAQPE
ncbi:hypothetical protein PM082_015739 [Marasmius tenuissimus]|nr:hypothetical protein PM082_015739 [Marasmius tenuissimus]